MFGIIKLSNMYFSIILFFGVQARAYSINLAAGKDSMFTESQSEISGTTRQGLMIFPGVEYRLIMTDRNGIDIDFFPPTHLPGHTYCDPMLFEERQHMNKIFYEMPWVFYSLNDNNRWIARHGSYGNYLAILDNNFVLSDTKPYLEFSMVEYMKPDENGNAYISFAGEDGLPIYGRYCRLISYSKGFEIRPLKLTFKFVLITTVSLGLTYSNYNNESTGLSFTAQNDGDKTMIIDATDITHKSLTVENLSYRNLLNAVSKYFTGFMKARNNSFGSIVNNIQIKNIGTIGEGEYMTPVLVLEPHTCKFIKVNEVNFHGNTIFYITASVHVVGPGASEITDSEFNWIKARIWYSDVSTWELEQVQSFVIDVTFGYLDPYGISVFLYEESEVMCAVPIDS